jgi:hypothetical protein
MEVAMICSCFLHTAAAGGLIFAIENWHKEVGRREQRRLINAVEGESRP